MTLTQTDFADDNDGNKLLLDTIAITASHWPSHSLSLTSWFMVAGLR